MNNYQTKYEGSVVSLVKALNVESLYDFYELDLDLGEAVNYQQIDFNDKGHKNKYKQEAALGALIIKVGNINTCKYAFSAAADCSYDDLMQDMYMALFEREPELVKEVLTHITETYHAEQLRPVNPYKRKKGETEEVLDSLECFRVGDRIMWNNQSLTPILENFKILSDCLSNDKNVFQLDNLYAALQSISDYEDLKQFKSEIIDFLIKHNYALDYGVAPHFICQCHNDEKIVELVNHLEKTNPDLKEDMMLYLTKQFIANNGRNSELSSISYAAHEHDELSFLDNPHFINLVLSKNVFPDTVNTSLESLVKAHFMFIASNKNQFDEQVLMNIKPSESILAYLEYLDYDDKKLFLSALSQNTSIHDSINTEYAQLLGEVFLAKNVRYDRIHMGVAYHLSNNYQPAEKKEKLKEIITTLVNLPFNFPEKVSTVLSKEIANLDEEKQKEYFELIMPQTKVVNKIKI